MSVQQKDLYTLPTPNPDLEWYISQSLKMRLLPRCPFASCERCPRYYDSAVLLEHAGQLRLSPPPDIARLDAQWHQRPTGFREDEPEVVYDEKNLRQAYNLCPEVSYIAFGYFVSGVNIFPDSFDRDYRHRWMSQRHIGSADALWYWWDVTPRHYGPNPTLKPRAANCLQHVIKQ